MSTPEELEGEIDGLRTRMAQIVTDYAGIIESLKLALEAEQLAHRDTRTNLTAENIVLQNALASARSAAAGLDGALKAVEKIKEKP